VYCAASYVNFIGDGGEDPVGLKTHSCKGSSSGLKLFGRHRFSSKIHSCGGREEALLYYNGAVDRSVGMPPLTSIDCLLVLPVSTGLLLHD
jgi:hypothetical protein